MKLFRNSKIKVKVETVTNLVRAKLHKGKMKIAIR